MIIICLFLTSEVVIRDFVSYCRRLPHHTGRHLISDADDLCPPMGGTS
jgi:hypothetical protein